MRILLLAGEESGVLYAERIRAEVLKARPDAEIRGYGDYGFKVSDLAVMGVGAVLKKIFYFLRVKRTMERAIDEWKPDVVCTVDYPGMNLKLAAYAKARGVRTVHVVCPQVWAWKRGRIPKIEASLDKLCCFFPFEPKLFKPGFAEFVGHPLVDEMAQEKLNTEAQRHRDGREKILAILPGSRIGEIENILPTLLHVAQELQKSPCLCASVFKIIIPAANEKAYRKIVELSAPLNQAIKQSNNRTISLSVRLGGAREVLRQADAAVVASGTATLEAALAGCPTVLVYKVGWFFAFLARRFIKGVKHIGLANIIAEKAGISCPMPEFLQEDFTVENVLGKLAPWLTDEGANAAARTALSETMKLLKSDGDSLTKITRFMI